MNVIVTNEAIQIFEGDTEIVGWHADEWNEDATIIPGIANAIKLAYTNPKELKNLLGY